SSTKPRSTNSIKSASSPFQRKVKKFVLTQPVMTPPDAGEWEINAHSESDSKPVVLANKPPNSTTVPTDNCPRTSLSALGLRRIFKLAPALMLITSAVTVSSGGGGGV